MSLFLAITLAQAAPVAAQELQPIPALEASEARIAENDASLFWYAFEGCDDAPLWDLLTEDFRMVHDLGGLVADDRESFLRGIRDACEARQPGGANAGYANRRLLVPGSRSVTPLGEWGVLERGRHTFHERRIRPAGTYDAQDPGGPTWVQTGGAHYIHVWQWMAGEGRFRLNESISVDHGAMPTYPPELD